jgi:hypothetical protein
VTYKTFCKEPTPYKPIPTSLEFHEFADNNSQEGMRRGCNSGPTGHDFFWITLSVYAKSLGVLISYPKYS